MTKFALLLALALLLASCRPAPAPIPAGETPTPPTPTSAPTAVPTDPPPARRIVGYYGGWNAARGGFLKDVRADRLSHLVYAFSNVSPDGRCILGDPDLDTQKVFPAEDSVSVGVDSLGSAYHGNFNQLRLLKEKYPHLQALIGVGGWTWSENFSAAALTEESRREFVRSCIDLYLRGYPGLFDGIDIDWEYPVKGGLVEGRPEDKANYTLLLAEFRRQLDELAAQAGRPYLLTAALPAAPGTIQNIERAQVVPYLDWINLMTYDFHGTWDTSTNFNAPLYKTAVESEAALNVNAAVRSYLKAGIPPEKIVLGVPFYGRGWQGVPNVADGLYQKTEGGAAPGTWEAGAFDYKDIKQNYLPVYARFYNLEARVPWLYNPYTGVFISYDDPESLDQKARYVLDNGLGGAMLWELGQDDGELLAALYNRLERGSQALAPTPTPYSLPHAPEPGAGEFFDDFSYSGLADPALQVNGWLARSGALALSQEKLAEAANYAPANLAFATDPGAADNRLLQVSAVPPSGMAGLDQTRKFAAGTYAARLRFGEAAQGTSQSFTALAPLDPADSQPDYGQVELAYLADEGGAPVLRLRSEKLSELEPLAIAEQTELVRGELEGWHTLLFQVGEGWVKYFLDGAPLGEGKAESAPDMPLALGFSANLPAGAAPPAGGTLLEVDWVYYGGGQNLSQSEVDLRVAELRQSGTAYADSVEAWVPVTEASAAAAYVYIPGSARPFEKELGSVDGITLDGDLADWPGEPDFVFDQAGQIVYTRAGATWGGPADFSTRAWAGWAPDGLYFAFQVTDDKLVQIWSGSGLWQGDYMEVQIDSQLAADYDDTAMSDDDYQLGFTPGDFAGRPPEAAVWFGLLSGAAPSDIQLAARQTKDGYTLEAFLPAALLGGIELSEGAAFGMNINPSDTDSPGAPQKLMMSSSPVRLLTDPTTLGKISLVK